MTNIILEEIHGFISPGEYLKFLKYIEQHVSIGNLTEVPVDPNYNKDEIYGGRWFRESDSRQTWRLVPPDSPFRGIWEQVQRL